MSIPQEHTGRFFYHFTHLKNLDSILEHGMLCTNIKTSKGLDHENIAAESIQDRRKEMDVTCGPMGKVHDYIPFYFTTRNPMFLGVINSKNVDQEMLIFLAIPIQKLLESNVVFTDASANTTIAPNFYSDAADLDKLNWNEIDSTSWGSKNDALRHQRMAEVLVHEQVPLDWISNVIVWNKSFLEYTEERFKKYELTPKVQYEPLAKKFFYYTKWAIQNRSDETLVTGPHFLNLLLKNLQKKILAKRENREIYTFETIDKTLEAISKDFCSLEELKGIYKLETINDVHDENVGDHTLKVVGNLDQFDYYKNLSDSDQMIVKLSAYLHDIGKGPASKWKDGKQPAYPDHPADSLKMLERILSEEIKTLSDDDIRKICLLVGYHDILGDIVGRNRKKSELFSVLENENDLNMLIALSLADIKAIRRDWYYNLSAELPNIVKEFKQYNK
jgi:hypothetical protein